MFRRLPEAAPALAIRVDGQAVPARAGESVAAAMLAAGLLRFRDTPASGAARGPFCMMGVCFDCLVSVDGVGSRQACMVTVRDGMIVETQAGARNLGR
jgi:predicted molibdopterin-dependent oxidoreductase YjgC